MRIIFVGESWLGSCARSLKEALARQTHLLVDEVNPDHYFPKGRARWSRAARRLLWRGYVVELEQAVMERARLFRPQILVVYKGTALRADFIRRVSEWGIATINVFPDLSPHAHGSGLRVAVGAYDLVISTKPFHPALWKSVYGYNNVCTFVAQGYDPLFHLYDEPALSPPYDVILAATWRPEYHELMVGLGQGLAGKGVKVALAGAGWAEHRHELPDDWRLIGPMEGRTYVEFLRSGRIAIAPVTRKVLIEGQIQSGDEDTTRTYELAAAHCFFIHRRTEFVRQLYVEDREVPMFDTPEELAAKILRYLPLEEERQRVAAAAHRRAVPAYSTDARAEEIVAIMQSLLEGGRKSFGKPI